MSPQGNVQRLAQHGLLESLSQYQLQQLLAQHSSQQQAQRSFLGQGQGQDGPQGLWQGRSNSPAMNSNGGNGLLDPGRRLYQR